MIGEPHGLAVTSQGKVYFSEDYYIRSMYGTIPTPAPTVSVHTSSGGSSSASHVVCIGRRDSGGGLFHVETI
eukprot:gene9262-10054_t